MTNQSIPQPIVVVGATGKTGRRVTNKLRTRGVPTRGVSRSSAVRMDWHDPSTWPAVLDGAEAAYITYAPDLCVPDAPDAVARFGEQAVGAGVERLVLLSGRGEPEAYVAEKALRSVVPQCTVVRSSWFAQNFSEGAFGADVAAGTLVLPVDPKVREPFVDADDVADVVVACLLDGRHAGQTYEVSGPRAITFPDALHEIAQVANRDVTFETTSADQFAAFMSEVGVPADEIGLLIYLMTEVLDGRNEHVADGVQLVLGRPARDFSDFARTAAEAGFWTEVSVR